MPRATPENMKTISYKNRYWHRSINVEKLLSVKFTHLGKHMTLQSMQKFYQLPKVKFFF
jgi:hypothetical protein